MIPVQNEFGRFQHFKFTFSQETNGPNLREKISLINVASTNRKKILINSAPKKKI